VLDKEVKINLSRQRFKHSTDSQEKLNERGKRKRDAVDKIRP
jgi:hypothetical protein